jgi:hypothetical protein
MTQIEFWPKLTVQNPHVGALGGDGSGAVVDKAFREYPVEVVGHFAL